VSAGERSGDLRAGALIEALRREVPGLEIRGLGGERLEACGLVSEVGIDRLAVMGFVEVIRHLPFFYRLLGRLTGVLRTWQPHRVLLVDYPGFNLRLAKRAARLGIPVTYYISPQVWAWGRGRVSTLRSTVDQMLVLFDFEKKLYDQAGIEAVHVGHPLVDEVAPAMTPEVFRAELGTGTLPILALLPGSRIQEVRTHMSVMAAAVMLVDGMVPVVGLAPGIEPFMVPEGLRWTRHVYDLLAAADVAVVASGTVTLEAAVLGIPMVVVYRTHALSAFLARRMLSIPYVAMANVVAGRRIVPECLQADFTPRRVAAEVIRLREDPSTVTRMRQDLAEVARRLGPPGASIRAARALALRLPR